MAKNTRSGPSAEPDDVALLAAVARMWELADPPPVGLADGAIARIAAEDLEFDLLILVSSDGALAGVRHSAPEERDEAGAWMLEYEGPDVRIYVRLTRIEDRTPGRRLGCPRPRPHRAAEHRGAGRDDREHGRRVRPVRVRLG